MIDNPEQNPIARPFSESPGQEPLTETRFQVHSDESNTVVEAFDFSPIRQVKLSPDRVQKPWNPPLHKVVTEAPLPLSRTSVQEEHSGPKPLKAAPFAGKADDEEAKAKPWQRLAVVGILLLFVVAIAIQVYSYLFQNTSPSLVRHFEGIRRVEKLRLVRHTYLEVIPFTKGKNNKLEFLVEAPAHIYGMLDMSRLEYEETEDGQVSVALPPAELSEVWIELENIRETSFRGKRLSLTAGSGAHGEAYRSITATLGRTRESIRESAIRNGILEDTQRKGRTFVMNQLQALGYRVRFTDEGADALEFPEMMQEVMPPPDKEKNTNQKEGAAE